MTRTMRTRYKPGANRLRVGAVAGALVLACVVVANPAAAAVTFRAAASAATNGSAIAYGGEGGAANRGNCGSINPGLPAGTTAGDLLLAVIAAGAQPTITMTGWNRLFTASGAANETAAIYWRIATGGDPTTITQSGTCNVIIG